MKMKTTKRKDFEEWLLKYTDTTNVLIPNALNPMGTYIKTI